MVEGMVILDAFDKILFCNKRAIRILDSENREVGDVVNHNVLVLCRNENFRNGIKFPPQTTKLETSFEMYKRTIKMIANQITDGDKKIGATILLIDITEQADREKLRREFSANVSHELKTPLTVISGCGNNSGRNRKRKRGRRFFQENSRRVAVFAFAD